MSTQGQSQLHQLFTFITQHKITDYQIMLTGAADSVGTFSKNYALNAQAFLVSQGITNDKITSKILGELSTKTQAEHHRNRQVKVEVYWKGPPQITQPTPIKEDNILSFFEFVRQASQSFIISGLKDTVLVGKQGSKIYLKAHSFYIKSEQKKYNFGQPYNYGQ